MVLDLGHAAGGEVCGRGEGEKEPLAARWLDGDMDVGS